MISDRRHEIGMFHSWISAAVGWCWDDEKWKTSKGGNSRSPWTQSFFYEIAEKVRENLIETSSIFHSVRVVTTFRTFLETYDDARICGISRMCDVGSWRISLCSQFFKMSTMTWFWRGDDKEMKIPGKSRKSRLDSDDEKLKHSWDLIMKSSESVANIYWMSQPAAPKQTAQQRLIQSMWNVNQIKPAQSAAVSQQLKL